MPLNLADINTDYIIQKICGNENERHHLETLWFFLKEQRYGFCRFFFGSYIVRIQESKIGINQDFAKMIIVQV